MSFLYLSPWTLHSTTKPNTQGLSPWNYTHQHRDVEENIYRCPSFPPKMVCLYAKAQGSHAISAGGRPITKSVSYSSIRKGRYACIIDPAEILPSASPGNVIASSGEYTEEPNSVRVCAMAVSCFCQSCMLSLFYNCDMGYFSWVTARSHERFLAQLVGRHRVDAFL